MGYGFGNCGSTGNYGNNCQKGNRYGNTFALIVVLFILLIIVGASFYQ